MILSKHWSQIGIGILIVACYLGYLYFIRGDGYILSGVIGALVSLIIGSEAYTTIQRYKNQVQDLMNVITDLRRQK